MVQQSIETRRAPRASALIACAAALAGSCGSTGGGQGFATPDAAAEALIESIRAEDNARLKAVLGPGADEIVSSGDSVADTETRAEFLAAYDKAHRVESEEPGTATLLVGEGDWPLPIPIVQDGGSWRFDAVAGSEEILARRIGRNELDAIETCRAIVDAQREYWTRDPEFTGKPSYAQRFISRPGRLDGLYWQTKLDETPSPLGSLVAEATAEGYTAQSARPQQPFHGYCYRMLDAQGAAAPGGKKSYVEGGRMTGGFAVVAWPAAYDRSGIMSFLVSEAGIVYERDLGAKTDSAVEAITSFDPGEGWNVVP